MACIRVLRGVLYFMLCKVGFTGRIMVSRPTAASAMLPWATRGVDISELHL